MMVRRGGSALALVALGAIASACAISPSAFGREGNKSVARRGCTSAKIVKGRRPGAINFYVHCPQSVRGRSTAVVVQRYPPRSQGRLGRILAYKPRLESVGNSSAGRGHCRLKHRVLGCRARVSESSDLVWPDLGRSKRSLQAGGGCPRGQLTSLPERGVPGTAAGPSAGSGQAPRLLRLRRPRRV